MRLSTVSILGGTFVAAAALSATTAFFAALAVERSSADGVRLALDTEAMNWTDVAANGLQIMLSGTAPSEAERFRAITVAGQVVDASRVIDDMDVTASKGIAPPRFSIELLRNDGQLNLIGLIPAATDRDALVERLSGLPGVENVVDLLETADHRVPESWPLTLDYAVAALRELPRSKISLSAGEVTVTAMTSSVEKQRKLETDLQRRAPGPIDLTLDISAPRPVITPFTLRYLIDEQGARFDACSADTEETRRRILTAARGTGLEGEARCVLGLGVPSPEWAEATSSAILALGRIGRGSVTFSDADVTLIAAESADRATFDRVVGELENTLPDVFALHAVFPETDEGAPRGPAEFSATLSPEGQVQLRGRVHDELSRQSADSYARSRFGSDDVYFAARLDDSVPEGWSLRVLAGLQALSELANGAVTVTETAVTVRGVTGNADANADIARILSDRLGDGEDFTIEVTYDEKLDPEAALPTPEECIADVKSIQESRKINFEPGSATVTGDSRAILDDIAEVLKFCGPVDLEIGGHTDSQGREIMNEQLSQDRADTVLAELRQRRVKTAGFVATGYGETQPIADNDTEEGREENRRIEFSLIAAAAPAETDSVLESTADSGTEEATGEAGDDAAEEPSEDEQN
ncbi:OmpA domain protein [Pseudooceanicola batsensis HTCC2597]|uniref:OmpA domain protein n=1 Tax=Pseudooceanicola batsensis (strain ATCC BAA-863 / DSM 15984 / KCTC 12145 / HTCC2597) TaxID=252305 RepID=A3TU05_PSEBH|nr:OmpA family protein [Pseudooceanicola batsensis]EAQ05132.1 OmpA domain protein [Pseudooceanicola batsensis HTCC2597]